MDLGLARAKALVQGGTKGMGRAAAECLAWDEASVAVLSRTREDLDETVGRLRELGAPQTLALRADIARLHEVQAALDVVKDHAARRHGEMR